MLKSTNMSHICSVSQHAHIFSKVEKEHRHANEYVQKNTNQAQDETRLPIM